MIPYLQLISFKIGPLTIYVWGLMVALGIIAGTYVAARFGEKRGLKREVFWDLAFWCGLAGFVGARLFDELAYQGSGGYSSIGGFIGGTMAGLIYLKRKKLDVWMYADTAVFGLPLGYAIGRVGCFLIHDHPGTATNFFLGVPYPDGVVRHDLGLYQIIDGAVLFVIFLVLRKRKAPVGIYIAAFLLWYGTTRFFLDFLRNADARYIGLTPAQYAAIAMIPVGCWAAKKTFKKV